MADRLPSLDIPPELLGEVPAGQAAHAADWALKFGRGDTSLAQRQQHNDDLGVYAQQLHESQAAHQAQVLQNSAGARALFFKQQDLQRQQQAATAKATIDAANQQRAAELHPLKLDALRAKASADASAEARRLSEDKLKSDTLAHENGFFTDRATFLTANPGATQEQIDANDISLSSRYPHAMKGAAAKEIVTAAMRGSLARQREVEKAAALTTQNATAAAASDSLRPGEAITASGAHTYRNPLDEKAKTEKAAKPDTFEAFNKDLKAAVDAHGDSSSVPAEVWSAFEARKANLVKGLSSTPAAPERVATNPQTGEKVVFRDGKWQPHN